MILSLLAIPNWESCQVEFTTAFLNEHLNTPFYMKQPPGFEDPHHPNWLCKLNQLLYSLKQSLRQWNIKLHNAHVSLGLSNSKYDPTLYFKIRDDQLVGALTTHVDNLAIVGKPV